jgi:hypothetical protein
MTNEFTDEQIEAVIKEFIVSPPMTRGFWYDYKKAACLILEARIKAENALDSLQEMDRDHKVMMEERAAALEERDWWQKKHQEDNEALAFQLKRAAAEIERLTNCLAKANAGFEEHERKLFQPT